MAGTYESCYARILWDFDFLRGLAPDRLDGFSIGFSYFRPRRHGNLQQDVLGQNIESGANKPFVPGFMLI